MARKTQLIDKAHWLVATGISIGFFVCIFIFLIVGAAGPDPTEGFPPSTNNAASNFTCGPDITDCSVTVSATMEGITGYNQAVWLSATIDRPTDSSTQRPALLGSTFGWDQVSVIDMWGITDDGSVVPLSTNKTHVGRMTCKAGEVTCTPDLLFIQNYITYASYRLVVKFDSPHRAFVTAGLSPAFIASDVKINLTGGRVSESYTNWMVGAKYFFFTISLLMFIGYVYYLVKGPGALDPRQRQATLNDVVQSVTGAQGTAKVEAALQLAKGIPGRLPMTWNQRWVLALSFFLILFNDPLFVVGLKSPNLAYQGFYAVCAVTFLALLLLYWLVSFDKARSEFGLEGDAAAGATSRLARICNLSAIASAMCFWLPKIIIILVLWVTSLSLVMWQSYQKVADPTYQITETFQGYSNNASTYFFNFMATIAVFYTLYLAFLCAQGLSPKTLKAMRPSSRYVLIITVFSILLIIIAVFLGGFSAQRLSSSLFMAAYGGVNCYLWFLQIALLPLYPPSADDLTAESRVRSPELDNVRVIKADMYDAGVQTNEEDFGFDDDFAAQQSGAAAGGWTQAAQQQQWKSAPQPMAAAPRPVSASAPNPFGAGAAVSGDEFSAPGAVAGDDGAFDAIVPVQAGNGMAGHSEDDDLQQWR